MEVLTLLLFCAALLTCVLLELPILWALAFGLALFLLYGRRKGFSWRELLHMALEGVAKVRNILITFALIGVLTALWRAAGTVPAIVCRAAGLILPPVYLLMSFLLCCGVSFLMGTSFGTAATMGVICAAVGAALGVDVRLTGGAVLSGVMFGDRCSPVSTSALLVAELTGTSIFDNIRRMLRTALAPFLLSCAVYAALGFFLPRGGIVPDLRAVFASEFDLGWYTLLPAAAILLLSALRVNVKLAMGVSILTAIPLCLAAQHIAPLSLLRVAVLGFRAESAEAAALVDGGGLVSMLRVLGIVCLSSAYSGIFQRTGLLGGVQRAAERLAKRTTPFAATACTGAVASMIACNQTLSILLTHQLCRPLTADPGELAVDLEDSVVVLAPLVPWSIAGAIPLAMVGAPPAAVLWAVYLYLLPLWRLGGSLLRRREKAARKKP